MNSLQVYFDYIVVWRVFPVSPGMERQFEDEESRCTNVAILPGEFVFDREFVIERFSTIHCDADRYFRVNA